ncbi:dienelactone hydrolase family protein [Novosphingobium sp. KA1]|uniref:dienelactone hydrolase family protein n=1 Tax=Novosphingobium sp. (strain KA1) TaxID=164608 RepID=UPI001A8EE5BD|nr:dienelactone hydrolase family protein [Novosphingobium sp. KA1]QSR20363.1 dienelactone hydrolase [Novosphingobium sp. KA1]
MTRTRELNLHSMDGTLPVTLHLPEGDAPGPFPPVILYMDGPGIRPAVQEIAARLSSHSFAVFLPDLFHRAGHYAPVDPMVVFTDPELRTRHRETLMASATPANAMADTQALLAAIETVPEAAPGPLGVVGYCMGGRLALIAAATFPECIGAIASFHGGGLATEKPGSPHLLADRIKARVYIAGAIEDANFTEEQKGLLVAAFEAARLDHRIETFPARHGWVPRDTAVHDPAEAEHHWRELVPFLENALRG